MAKTSFPNLERFAHQCINLKKDTITISATDARGVSNEYAKLLEHIVHLQALVIQLQEAQDRVIEVEIDNGTF
jgi:hypothetical protein|tara:strand:+ start:546 stop:764 length:219 start_codon:yes stop_codon:yes gene_type:complete